MAYDFRIVCCSLIALLLSSAAVAQDMSAQDVSAQETVAQASPTQETVAQATGQHLTFKAFGDKSLCSSLIFDESKVPPDSDYGREFDYRNADIPEGGEVLSLSKIPGGDSLEKDAHPLDTQSTEFQNTETKVSTFDFLNNGKLQNVYHLYESSHYFDGDLYIVTDASVPEKDVATVIATLASPDGGLDDAEKTAKAHGWLAFTGGETFYGSVRYTTMTVFKANKTTYLVNTGQKPGPVATVSKPLPNGQMKDVCFFYSASK